jgi:hypothetical protein
MVCKTFEIRDAATFIPVLAIKLTPGCENDRYLLARAGYGRTLLEQSEYVIVCSLTGDPIECTYDSYSWAGPARTLSQAHDFIMQHFDQLESGEVIDVQFILGETASKKLSERFTE